MTIKVYEEKQKEEVEFGGKTYKEE